MYCYLSKLRRYATCVRGLKPASDITSRFWWGKEEVQILDLPWLILPQGCFGWILIVDWSMELTGDEPWNKYANVTISFLHRTADDGNVFSIQLLMQKIRNEFYIQSEHKDRYCTCASLHANQLATPITTTESIIIDTFLPISIETTTNLNRFPTTIILLRGKGAIGILLTWNGNSVQTWEPYRGYRRRYTNILCFTRMSILPEFEILLNSYTLSLTLDWGLWINEC